jgi:hypothetical protein
MRAAEGVGFLPAANFVAVAERSPEACSPSGSHETDLAKARKQQKDGRSECRQIVTLNPIEELKARAVELISPCRFEDLWAGSSKVATHELRRERPHRQLSRLYVGPDDIAFLG